MKKIKLLVLDKHKAAKSEEARQLLKELYVDILKVEEKERESEGWLPKSYNGTWHTN